MNLRETKIQGRRENEAGVYTISPDTFTDSGMKKQYKIVRIADNNA